MTSEAANVTSNKLSEQVDDNNFTEEELAMLSDEERAALELDDTDDKEDGGEVEDSDDKPDSDEEKDNEEEELADKEVPDSNENKDSDEDSDEGSDEDLSNKDDNSGKVVETESVSEKGVLEGETYTDEQYKADMKKIIEDELDGEIEPWEKEVAINEINFKLNQSRLEAINEKQMAADAQASWDADQAAFFEANPRFAENVLLNGALNSAIQEIDSTDEGRRMSGAQLLYQAALMVEDAFGAKETTVDKEEKVKVEEKKPTRPRPKKSDKQAPDGLSDIPAADDSDGGEKSLFEKLDSLSGEELEDAVSSLSPADRVRYEKML